MYKRIVFFVVFSLSALVTFAQDKAGHKPHRPDISECVSDLSARQKKQLEVISNESRALLKNYRQELKQVRDSIHHYMALDGDQSAYLFPLFDREGALQVKISRELYSLRVKTDKVLTPEQRKELKAKMQERKEKDKQGPKGQQNCKPTPNGKPASK